MNKTALREFATNARRQLLKKMETSALKYGISAESIKKANVESSDAVFIDGKQLSREEKIQRNKLIDRMNQIGFHQVLEEVAYTWFNRFTALRFMEVNDYLPTRVRVLSSLDQERHEPDMIKEALSLDLELDQEYVYELKMNNETEKLFKYLIIQHCNALYEYMPFMFETVTGYTELLFPEGLLASDSFIREMTNTSLIPEEDWQKVEIIGWLYQYYIADEKDRVIKAKNRYKKEEIPFATQLFTPEWIVRYMVQNALGRYWIESHPEHRDLIGNWEYFLENPNPKSDVAEKLAPYLNKDLDVEQIKCFDPAMGSGHILVYMFDVLYEIYSKCGYTEREIPRLIIENNLFGLDIDDRAYQLASFSLIMKAMEYHPRFLSSIKRKGLKLNVASIQETNGCTEEDIAYIAGEEQGEKFERTKAWFNQFLDGKTIGSLLHLEETDLDFFHERLRELEADQNEDLFSLELKDRNVPLLKNLLHQAEIMKDTYDVFVTNPPYVGNRYLTPAATAYLQKYYPDVKSDLFSAFIEYSFSATKPNGQIGFMTPFVWMFISTYEKLRKKIIQQRNISSLIQLEYSGFDEATVPICTFTLRNYKSGTSGEYIKLSDFKGAKNQPIQTLKAVQNPEVSYRYTAYDENFSEIPGSPIAYWASPAVQTIFAEFPTLSEFSEPRLGMATADNHQFLRFWYEVAHDDIHFSALNREQAAKSGRRWFPYQKGGEYRKWFGNAEYVVDWEDDGRRIRNFTDSKGKVRSHNYNLDYIFKLGITWSALTSGRFGARFSPGGFLFDNAGSSLFCDSESELYYIQGYLSTKIVDVLFPMINPTLNYQPGTIGVLPIKDEVNLDEKQTIIELVKENNAIAKMEWDQFETSWDFKSHPILTFKNGATRIETAFENWQDFSEQQFQQLKANEEKINDIFIHLYGLQAELKPEVEDKDITYRRADLEREIKSFISYAVGCALGRYSLDEEGLICAGGPIDHSKYKTFPADEDHILPILPDAYMEDDIVTRFIEFVRVVFGDDELEANLEFIANVLKRRKNETARETLYRYFIHDFFKDHVQMYKKRPIYWLFTSGKEKAFNCLVYSHRYDKATLSRIRTDYLHEYQVRLEAVRGDLLSTVNGEATTREINQAKKELQSLDKKIGELQNYDELLHHMADRQIEIDLDAGVKTNYETFKGLVAKL